MSDENTPLTEEAPEESAPQASVPSPSDEQTPPRPQYTKKQRVLALIGAIAMVILTLMYTYSIATGDLFFR